MKIDLVGPARRGLAMGFNEASGYASLAALHPAVWGFGQLLTGWWSDRIGRKRLIVAGLLIQAAAIALVAAGTSFGV